MGTKETKRKETGKKAASRKAQACCCPYCEEEVAVELLAVCKPCGVTLRYCSKCKAVVERAATVCPRCGQALA